MNSFSCMAYCRFTGCQAHHFQQQKGASHRNQSESARQRPCRIMRKHWNI
ncbi:Uncharacterized protein APZ42_032852 [Daphnia magna]|uniref:Uncharacterized protein n=1 Tax=Daphnia magna TaxID=35525 RepID=A0A164LXI5_9CRUS|nr:Uncharacterized protein APZ42_032852 [Daphnia magna]